MDIFIQILSYLAAFGVAVFSTPETINVIRKKRTDHLNILLFLLLFLSAICFIISGLYGLITSKSPIAEQAFPLAVTIANVFSGTSSAIILSEKIYNRVKGKKNNMSEKEYGELRYKNKLEKKNKKEKNTVQ